MNSSVNNASHFVFKSFYNTSGCQRPIPVAVRPKAWVCGRSLAGIAGSNPAGGMNVSFECCVLSGRGLCVGLITRPEESYRVWCVCVCVCVCVCPGPISAVAAWK